MVSTIESTIITKNLKAAIVLVYIHLGTDKEEVGTTTSMIQSFIINMDTIRKQLLNQLHYHGRIIIKSEGPSGKF